MRYHKARVKTGFCHQEVGQAAFAANELGYALTRDGAEFGECDCQEVHYNGKRLAVEVSCRDYHIFFGDNGRVVGSRIYFGFDHGAHIGNGVFRRAVYLWHTTE